MGPDTLAQVLCSLPRVEDENLLTREEVYADAGIYRISPDTALVQSVDFFTPVVDDPYWFGQIAAANSLSDIYAAGGWPLTALNLVGFPCSKVSLEVLKEILRGGQEKVEEAGAVVVGGHSVEDSEPKYGLSVTGLVDPERRLVNSGAQPGDRLVLTKPLGTGILTTALKGGMLQADQVKEALEGMAALNSRAMQAALKVGVNACTDITGFGLLGHAAEIAEASKVAVILNLGDLPLYRSAREMAGQGMIPGGTHRNHEYYREVTENEFSLESNEIALDLVADPQTSGGLLFSVSPEKTAALLEALSEKGETGYVIGEARESNPGKVLLLD